MMVPPAKKQCRRAKDEEEAEMNHHSLHHSLPDDLLLQAFAYTERRDVAALCRVCRKFHRLIMGSSDLWKELAIRSAAGGNSSSVLEEMWQSLHGHARAATRSNDNDNEQPLAALLDDAALWRRISASRESSCRRVLKQGSDYDLVTDRGLPAFELDEELLPDWMKPLPFYSFAVHVWDANGKKLSMAAISGTIQTGPGAPLGGPATNIHLYLGISGGGHVVGKVLRSGKFRALQIEVCYENRSALLYSSLNNPLQVYGGGRSFEEYSAMPWFEWEGDESEEQYPPEYIPERWDWLPFVVASVVPPLPQPDCGRTYGTTLNVEMQWRCRSTRCKRGDDYDFVQGMNVTEILTFLKHRADARRGEFISKQEPHCVVQESALGTTAALLPTRDYAPKPLSTYSFLVEVKNTKDSAKNCSIFYECLSEDSVDDDNVQFEIPTRYDDFFPWGEDYPNYPHTNLHTNFPWVEIDTIFTVFVIDRQTGMQAMLYESDTTCALWEYFDLSPFVEFEKCAALSLYSNGSEVNTIPVPSVRGFIASAYKEEPSETRSLDLHFEFLYYKAGNPGTGAAAETLEFSRTDILAFLENGLIYK